MGYIVKSPILFLSFNRLDTTKRVFEKIAKMKPKKLYLASDGARESIEGEREKVECVREYILSSITWECEVKSRFLDKNLGCKYAVSSAIEWFFSNEVSGIILEDDCLPSESFFRFCDENLEKYKDYENIFMISGWSTLDFNKKLKDSMKESYYFSKYGHIWGWASWARAWSKYELENEDFIKDFNKMSFDSMKEKRERRKVYRSYFSGEIDTWDYPWSFSIAKHDGLCIYPRDNMIENIGFNRADATHTTGKSKFEDMKTYEISFPLLHPHKIERNIVLDKANYCVIGVPNIIFRIFNKLKRILLGVIRRG